MQGKCTLCGGYITGKATKGQARIFHRQCLQRPAVVLANNAYSKANK